MNLDRDDITSYGPETVTVIKRLQDGVYTYSIHNYTGRYLDEENQFDLSNSGAMVQVYRGEELIETFHVPLNQPGNSWRVFEIHDGEIVPVNIIETIVAWRTPDSFLPIGEIQEPEPGEGSGGGQLPEPVPAVSTVEENNENKEDTSELNEGEKVETPEAEDVEGEASKAEGEEVEPAEVETTETEEGDSSVVEAVDGEVDETAVEEVETAEVDSEEAGEQETEADSTPQDDEIPAIEEETVEVENVDAAA